MRSWLEEKGWRQGCFVSPLDIHLLISHNILARDISYLIVASQSCDVCASSEVEPYIEFSIATKIESIDGNYMFNKNPRRLHLKVSSSENNGREFYIEILSDGKISIKKDEIARLRQIEPYPDYKLTASDISQYANWLAGKYNRPALPTTFERLFNEQWSKSKREKTSGKHSEHILGIFVDIDPDREILEDEVYSVQLLFLISETADNDKCIREEIEKLANEYIKNLKESAKITVLGDAFIKTRKGVSLATFSKYKRFNLDSLSYRSGHFIDPIISI